jgi:pimeloyl-ACP methyl ester carboxylesterase
MKRSDPSSVVSSAARGHMLRAERRAMPSAGHVVPYEQPEAFVQAVQKFLG